jgi:hypothetical protein
MTDVRVRDLRPGMTWAEAGINGQHERWVYIAQAPHPLYPGLQLVIWRDAVSRRWSHDALSPHQVIYGGSPLPLDQAERELSLRTALLAAER